MSATARTWSWRSQSLRELNVPRWMSGPLIPVVVAGALGIVGIGDKSLWLDEAFSAAVARLPTLDWSAYLFHNELHASPYLPIPWSGTALPGEMPQNGVPPTYTNPRIWLVERQAPQLSAALSTAIAGYRTTDFRDFGPDGPTVTLPVSARTP